MYFIVNMTQRDYVVLCSARKSWELASLLTSSQFPSPSLLHPPNSKVHSCGLFIYTLSVTQSYSFRSHLYTETLKFILSSDFQYLIFISVFPVIYHIPNYFSLPKSPRPCSSLFKLITVPTFRLPSIFIHSVPSPFPKQSIAKSCQF